MRKGPFKYYVKLEVKDFVAIYDFALEKPCKIRDKGKWGSNSFRVSFEKLCNKRESKKRIKIHVHFSCIL